eukprot:7385608-Prymnesium_polylepis.1
MALLRVPPCKCDAHQPPGCSGVGLIAGPRLGAPRDPYTHPTRSGRARLAPVEHGPQEPRPHVARVGRLSPRRPAAADPVRDCSRGGACRARRDRPARKNFGIDAT